MKLRNAAAAISNPVLAALATTLLLVGLPGTALAAPEDCVEDGGLALCTAPIIAPPGSTPDSYVDAQKFSYGMCDVGAPHMFKIATWCAAQGGTWVGPQTNCVGLPASSLGVGSEASEATAIAAGEKFATNNGNCQRTLSSDSQWGFSEASDQFCWSGGTETQNDIVIREIRRQVFVGQPSCEGDVTIKYLKTRKLVCPNKYASRMGAGGKLECFLPPTEDCCAGNPVDLATGAKLQRELDYSSADGLEFIRYYHSQLAVAPFTDQPFVPSRGDYWRHSFSRKLFVPPGGNVHLMAIRQGDDGSLTAFNASGAEMHNGNGSGSKLENLGAAGWKLTLANSDVENYDAIGRFSSKTTRGGLVVTAGYDSTQQLATLTDSFGKTLTLGYDAYYRLISLTLPDASQITYTYDERERPETVTYPDGKSKTYHHENVLNGWLLTGITDENESRFSTYTYNADGYVDHETHAGVNMMGFQFGDPKASEITTRVWDANGFERQYTISKHAGVFRPRASSAWSANLTSQAGANFDAAGNATARWDKNNRATGFVYDPVRNLETSRTEGYAGGTPTSATRTITTQWHSTFRLPTEIKVYPGTAATGTPLRTTTFTHDSAGNVLTATVTDPASSSSRTSTYTYDTFGRVLTQNGPRTDVADVTTYAYYQCSSGAECGQLHTVTNALNQVVSFDSYSGHGQPTKITDPNNVVTTLAYDARRRLVDRCEGGLLPICAGGELTHLEYWPTGFLKKAVQPDGSFIQYSYDAAHRLTQIEDALGNRVSYVLDAAGNRTAENAYDPYGTLLRTQRSLYNSLGQLWQVLTASGSEAQATVLGYDASGLQTVTYAPLGRTTNNVYDELRRLKQVVDPAGRTTSFAYDAADNLTQVTDPKGLVTNYQYDGFGGLKTLTSPDTGVTSNSYDSGGNLLTSTNARGAVTASTYDALNRVTSTSFSIGASTDQALSFTYDQGVNGKGHLTGASDANHSLAYSYDALGRVTNKSQTVGPITKSVAYAYADGRATSMLTPSGQSVVYTYDAAGRVSGISINGSPLLSQVQYEPFGPLNGWTWANNTLTVRNFDLDGQLDLVDSAGLSTYTFHDDGSIASRMDDTLGSYALAAGTTNHSVSASSNRLTGSTGVLTRAYSYDAAGNTINDGTTSFTYNFANRMSSATRAGVTANYTYNALGQRVRKIVGSSTRYYFYDEAGQLIGEYDGAGALIQETIWFGNVPVATLRPDGSGGVAVFYVHTDHLNTPRRVSRPSDNAIVWRWDSDPYGAALANEDPDGDTQLFAFNLRFPGQQFDAETGLNYNYFRDYDPAIGRYVESDPIGLDGGINTFAYADSNALSFIDPLGLWGFGDPLPQGVVDAFGGFGDGLTGGATRWIRQHILGLDGVDPCSSTYRTSEWMGIGASLAVPAARAAYVMKVSALPRSGLGAREIVDLRNALKAHYRGRPLDSLLPRLGQRYGYPTLEALLEKNGGSVARVIERSGGTSAFWTWLLLGGGSAKAGVSAQDALTHECGCGTN
jgi:RHS repeat-associated protein